MFVNFPMGNPFGPANKPDYQRDILRTALEMVNRITTAGEIVDVKDSWQNDFTDKVTRACSPCESADTSRHKTAVSVACGDCLGGSVWHWCVRYRFDFAEAVNGP